MARLIVRSLRNLEHVEFEPSPRLNVISGSNGQGKTSLLEAIYFAATSRSFRTHRMGDLVTHGSRIGSSRARFVQTHEGTEPLSREQVASIEGKRCVVLVDGNRPSSLASFATLSPVVAFHPNEMTLTTGPASGRRVLLDRLALFMSPSSGDHRRRYETALRARQEILQHGQAGRLDELEAYEELCARHGAAVTRARAAAVDALMPELIEAFASIAAPELSLSVNYAAGGSQDVEVARVALRDARSRDARRPTASFGPHKDDVDLALDGHPVRLVASQGQHRALTLALKVAETAAIRNARRVEPVLLFDDVSSELDRERTEALMTYLGLTRGQLFLTTTRPELIVTPRMNSAERRDFHIDGGVILGTPPRQGS
ncbi:DNA replication/repair protein RecF [Chondromyces crocatus]|uniref:DNA replication and repair protein RecF n=1 Tax=Chondromyces crocatus TaxID=52 RepID=A0A0K1E6E4_CHOCO|nr:DNA replication and repair protein RecF [Chondromyces crocatus]AKT36429.1 DNA recombination protein RecF [Chondromyces crocatus]